MLRSATIILIVMSVVAFVVAPCYCEEEAAGRQPRTVNCQVAAVDWVGGILVVSWLQIDINTLQELTFSVPAGFGIKKGTGTIDLADLEIGDALIVTYYENADGSKELVSITDTSPI